MTFSNSINWLRRDGPRWENLGITLSAGIFSITAADGTALSQSNAGYVTIPSSANPGRQIVYRIIAAQSFQDVNGTNTLGNSLFGLTTNIAYTQDLPFYIYAAADSSAANLTFFISRVPHRCICPVAANIGQSGNTNASTQGSFFALQAVTAANFDSQPCICIGAFRMRYASAASPWTVQTLSNGSFSSGNNIQADGIGCFHDATKFFISTGQFGAASGSFFKNNGGTAPAWSVASVNYSINQFGLIYLSASLSTNTAGSGAVQAQFALPFINIDAVCYIGNINLPNNAGWCVSGSNSVLQWQAVSTAPSLINVTNATLAASPVTLSANYKVSID